MRVNVLVWLGLVALSACSRTTLDDEPSARALAERNWGWSSLAPRAGDAEHGEYLATIGGCKECHTPRTPSGELDTTKLFAGGIPASGPWGVVAPANVSQIARTMPPAQLEDMIRGRLSYKFQMPTALYQEMAADDMRDLVSYLQTVTPVARAPFANVYRAGFQPPPPNPVSTPLEHAPSGVTVERGRYLASIVTCKDCHSPRTRDGFHYDEAHLFAGGGFAFRAANGRPIVPPNLTPDAAEGLGTWTDEEILRALRTGVAKDGHKLNPVMPYGAALDDADAAAIVKYLRSLPAVSRLLPSNPEWKPTDPPDTCCFSVARDDLDAPSLAEKRP